MKINLYSVKDTKLGKFAQPFSAPNDDIAIRMLTSTVRASGNTINEFPEDYQLFKLGSYDEDTGKLASDVKFLVNAFELKTKEVSD